MSTRRRLLVAGVALVAMIVPLRGERRTSRRRAWESRTARDAPGGAGLGQRRRPRRRAVRAPAGDGRDLARRPQSGEPGALRERAAAAVRRAPVRRRHGRRVLRLDRVRPRQRRRIGISRRTCSPATPRHDRDLPHRRAFEFDARRGHRLVRVRQPADGFPFVVPTGVQFALEPYRGGFLVTDGHHNRVLRVTLDGTVTQTDRVRRRRSDRARRPREHDLSRRSRPCAARAAERQDRVLRTGIVDGDGRRLRRSARRGRRDRPRADAVRPLAGPLSLRRRSGLRRSSGFTRHGSAHAGERDRRLTTIADELDQPSSLEIIGNTAYVVTLGGEVWTIDDVAGPPYG